MNKQQQEVHLKAFTERMAAILLSKGDDYANEDRLSNFKLVGQICGIPPEKVVLVMAATKVVRLGNLLKDGKKPNNESIQDSNIDLSNYSALMDMVLEYGELIGRPETSDPIQPEAWPIYFKDKDGTLIRWDKP